MSVAASILAAAIATGAQAVTTVDVQFTGVGYGSAVNVISPGITGGVFAGNILISATNSSNTGEFQNGNYSVFCCDLYQWASGNVNPYFVVPIQFIPTSAPMGPGAAAAIHDMYAFANGAQYTSNDWATAFQLSIWEVVSDWGGPMDFNNGAFQANGFNGTVAAITNALFASIGSGGQANLIGVANEAYQDYIVENAGPVPSPGALALVGLSGLIGSRRRRA
jgi:MYXO-CTERM domain-containing protein